jgi:predicted Zn-dependent protease
MRRPQVFAVLSLCFVVLGRQAMAEQSSGTNPPDLFDALVDTAVKTAKQVDRIGLEATRMTDAEESALGAAIDKEVLRHTPALDDAAMQRRVATLAAPLTEQRRRQAVNYTVRILDSGVVNAYSIAGGYVYLTKAFLKEFPSDAAVVMALGHEIGHVDLRHCVEKVQYQAAGRPIAGDWAALAQAAYGTLRSAYTKDQEFDADAYGFEAACRAGWRPTELLDFIRGLAAYEQRQSQNSAVGETGQRQSGLDKKLADYLATHPSTPERLRKLEALAASSPVKTEPGE